MKKILTSIAAGAVVIGMGPVAQAQDIVLEVASWKGNEAEPAGLPEIIARFEEQNPGITVRLNYLARGEVDKVVTPRIMAGSPPSVVMADPALMIQWSQAGALADLGADSAFVSQMLPDVQSVMNRGGSYYVQPLELTGLGNFVNLGLLEEAGIEAPPTTLAELVDACAKLNEAGHRADGLRRLLGPPAPDRQCPGERRHLADRLSGRDADLRTGRELQHRARCHPGGGRCRVLRSGTHGGGEPVLHRSAGLHVRAVRDVHPGLVEHRQVRPGRGAGRGLHADSDVRGAGRGPVGAWPRLGHPHGVAAA